MYLKPRSVVDIKRGVGPFSRIHSRINLSSPITRIRLRTPLKVVLTTLLVSYFIVGFVVAPNYSHTQAAQDPNERAQLEAQLADLEKQIADLDKITKDYRSKGASLSAEIKTLDAKRAKLEAQIRVINLNLEKLNGEIQVNQGQILTTEEKLSRSKTAISNALQDVYEREQESLMLVLLKNPTLTDFSGAINDLVSVQTQLTVAVQEMNQLKAKLLDEKEALAVKKNDAGTLKALQDAQRKAVLAAKTQKDQLLTETKGQEAKYQAILKEKQKTAAEIRSRIFELLGGGQLTFEKAYEFAKFAGNAVGVRPALILAVMSRESAFGQNVGKCSYKTAMAPGPPLSRRDDVTPFLAITAKNGLNPETTLVSCANADGAYGGAMGPAQFIPTTWMVYAKRIETIAGNDNPWNNSAAFTGTALYLKDAGANGTTNGDRIAAAKYYAGGNWSRFLWTYGDWVVTKAAQFEEDIAAITAN